MTLINMSAQFIECMTIYDEVELSGGLKSMLLSEIVIRMGHQRLGSEIRKEIIRELEESGVGYYPIELPFRGNEEVRLWIEDGPYAELMNALLTVGRRSDRVIKRLCNSKVDVRRQFITRKIK